MGKSKAKVNTGSGGRTFANDVTVRLGAFATMVGTLESARKGETSKNEKTESACPGCHGKDGTVTKLDSIYKCSTDAKHGPYKRGEPLRMTTAGQIIATSEEIKEVRQEDVDDGANPIFDINVHYADEVETNVVTSGTCYVFSCSPAHTQIRDLFLLGLGSDGRILSDTDPRPMVLIGTVVLRKKAKFFQVRRWRDNLLLQEIARPEDLYPIISAAISPAEASHKKLLSQLLEVNRTDFDATLYADGASARLKEFFETRIASDAPLDELAPRREAATCGGDLLAQLQASLDANRKAS